MTQLVASDGKKAYDSDLSCSDDEQVLLGNSQVNKNIFTDKVARELVRSRNQVDVRLLKLHKMSKQTTRRPDLLDYLRFRFQVMESMNKTRIIS